VNETFIGPHGVGVGQNRGTDITVPLWGPTLYWSTGWQFLGANVAGAVVQPFYYTAAYPSNGTTLGGNGSGPPFGNTIWFENTANTLFTPVILQWTLGNGWFADLGIRIFEGYGLTETSPVLALNNAQNHRIGSVGKPIESVEYKFAPDGELLVREAAPVRWKTWFTAEDFRH